MLLTSDMVSDAIISSSSVGISTIFTLLSGRAYAAEPEVTPSIVWDYDYQTKTLTVSGYGKIDDFAIAFLFMLDARRVLILLRDYEVLIALADTLGHRTIVTARPDDEDHEQQRQPGIEIERDCLQEQREPVDVAALRQRGADSSGPARYWGDDADWCRRRIDDIREFRARNLELIRHRTHNRTNGQAVEIVINKDNQSQKRCNQRCLTLALNRARCPFTISTGGTAAGNRRH